MGTLERLARRMAYPIDQNEPDGIKVRAMRLDELKRMESLTPEQKTAFILGCGLLGDDGGQAFDQGDMAAGPFADWMLENAKIATDLIGPIVAAIERVSKPQPVETIVKN